MGINQTFESMHIALNIMRLMRPYRVDGLGKVRLGRLFDGGYIMLDSFENVTAAYSLGINDDVSWDLDVANRGIPIFQYDHTIPQLPFDHPLFKWEKLGISHEPDPERSFETVPNLIARNGHAGDRDLLLKCDIEGHEWAVLSTLPSDIVRQFRQIVIEVHDLDRIGDMKFANVVRAALMNLGVSHRVVHIHANNFAPWAVVGGVAFPSVLEISFARLDSGVFSVSDEIFPTPLDMPCHSREPDFYLGRFAYD